MKRTLQILTALVALSIAMIWVATGASRGWTKTSVAVKTLDEVTGIEAVRYERRFVAGLDFLAGGLLGAAFLAGCSIFSRNTNK